MTDPDDKQYAFWQNVTRLVAEKIGLSHYPDGRCLHDVCELCPPRYKWQILRELAFSFWNSGPDVSDDWKSEARRSGFEFGDDELHDIMAGILIGGDRPDRNKLPYRASDYTAYAPNP